MRGKKMKCYDMTKLDNLESINKLGLVPKSGENSKLIHDNKIKVFFSEGFEGAIALYVDFELVYHQIKERKIAIDDVNITNKIFLSEDLDTYLEDGVYLSFDKKGIMNERNFENGCTDQMISPDRLNVLVLKDTVNKKISYDRFDIIHYMMTIINPNQITYYGVVYPNSPSFEEATNKVQNKVTQYYDSHQSLIAKYRKSHYQLIEVPLTKFVKYYIKNK